MNFQSLARQTAHWAGHPITFSIAVILILAWAISGPFLGFSPAWQLIINTSTTILTFLMVFLIQATQNRDSKALHLKLDDLIHALDGTKESLIGIEENTEEKL